MADSKAHIYRVEENKVVDQEGKPQRMAVVGAKPKDPLQPNALESLQRWSQERQESVKEGE